MECNNRCQWEAQYDYEGPCAELKEQIEDSFTLTKWLAELGIEKKIYAGSLCLACGKFIRRNGAD